MRPVVAIALLLVPLAGCFASEGTPEQLAFDKHWVLAPGELAELNLLLDEGGRVTATWNASATLTWDVHSHSDTRGHIQHQNGEAAAGTIEFEAPATGGYSLSWQAGSDGGAVSLTVNATGESVLLSIAPERTPR